MLRRMLWPGSGRSLFWTVTLVCASWCVAVPISALHGQDVAPAVEPPAPKPEPVPVQPPAPDPDVQPDDPDSPAAPPPPTKDGDYAGKSKPPGAATQDSLANDTDEEPEAQVRRENPREFSIRIDPLNWLLSGRLRIELEIGIWKFLSFELIPAFVTSSGPLLVNYSRLDSTLAQASNGLGPISGVSLGVGFWLSGEPFSGYVIRLNFTNYAYTYRAADGGGTFDKVDFTERRLCGFFGSHSRFGPFTLAGGFGLGLELNQVERCGLMQVETDDGEYQISGRSSDCEGRQLIALNRMATETADLNGPTHPVYFEARISFGVVF